MSDKAWFAAQIPDYDRMLVKCERTECGYRYTASVQLKPGAVRLDSLLTLSRTVRGE